MVVAAEFQFKSSAVHQRLLLTGATLIASVIFILPLGSIHFLLLELALLLVYLRERSQVVSALAVDRLVFKKEAWSLVVDGDNVPLDMCRLAYFSSWLVVIVVRTEGQVKHRLFVFADMLKAAEYRHLLALLK